MAGSTLFDGIDTLRSIDCRGRCWTLHDQTAGLLPRAIRGPTWPPKNLNSDPTEGSPYLPLKNDQIRLVRLPQYELEGDLEGCGQDPAKCLEIHLVTVDLPRSGHAVLQGQRRPYKALSYCWGPEEPTYTILCNGFHLPVRANLAAALPELQDLDQPIYIWIDALCINQNDDAERATQVSRMLEIYQKADEVIAWLGPIDEDCWLATRCLMERELGRMKLFESSADGPVTHSSGCKQLRTKIDSALERLYGRPWLRRAWIRQEIYSAQKLVIKCGPVPVTWKQYADQGLALMREGFAESMEPALLDAWQNRRAGESKSPLRLADVLTRSYLFGAAEEHDIVYSVLGMCSVRTIPSDDNLDALPIDYKTSATCMYQHTSAYLIAEGLQDNLTAMWSCYKRSPLHENRDLPSWAVDWRSQKASDEDTRIIQQLQNDTKRPRSGQSWLPCTQADILLQSGQNSRMPVLSPTDPRVLKAEACFLNYVAYVTDVRDNIGDFVTEMNLSEYWRRKYRLGMNGRSIHARETPWRHGTLFKGLRFGRPNCTDDKGRVVILGLGEDYQIALAPETVQKGDLVVQLVDGMLPFLLRPCRQSDKPTRSLYPSPDPYDSVPTWRPESFCKDWIPRLSSLLVAVLLLIGLGPLIAAMAFAMNRAKIDSWAVIYVIVYLTIVFLLVSIWAWRNCVKVPQPSITKRRHVVSAYLKDITTIVGKDFELHGPVLVQHERRSKTSEQSPWQEIAIH